MGSFHKVRLFGLFGALLFQSVCQAQGVPTTPPSPRIGWDFKALEQIPVQSGGRIKPLDTFSRESVLFITGSRKFAGYHPTELFLSWMVFPEQWENIPFIIVTQVLTKRELGLDEKQSRFSFNSLIKDSYIAQYAHGVAQQAPPDKTDIHADPREQEKRRLVERIQLFRGVVSGGAWPIVPASPNWISLGQMDEPKGKLISESFRIMAIAYQKGDQDLFERSSRDLLKVTREQVQSEFPKDAPTVMSRLNAEMIYNQGRFFLWAWVLYLLGAIAFGVLGNRKMSSNVIKWGLASTALMMHAAGITFRCIVAGRPPVTNMYESVVWVAFGAVVFGLILYKMQAHNLALIVSQVLAAVLLILADGSPSVMDGAINPLVPVLRSNFWLTIHVLTITISYAAFAVSFGISHVTLFHFYRDPKLKTRAAKVADLNLMSYRAMQFGVVLVAAGTILGGVWADYSWGRFWGWDPKEVWALIVLMVYLILLHGRFAGWIRSFGFAVWSVGGFLSVIMAWYGVNFVLGVGLHSYGFSVGGRGAVATFTVIEILLMLWVWQRVALASRKSSGV